MPGPLILDLLAAVIEGGAPPHSALRSVGTALRAAGDPRADNVLLAASRLGDPQTAGRASAGTSASTDTGGALRDGTDTETGSLLAVLEEALFLAARSGLPPTALIRRAATEERRRRLSAQLRAIRRLEVLLVLPAGLCLLPAFVLLGIVPLVIDLVTG